MKNAEESCGKITDWIIERWKWFGVFGILTFYFLVTILIALILIIDYLITNPVPILALLTYVIYTKF